MIVLLTISVLLVALYVGATIWKHRELPDSVSAMVYYLKKGNSRWIWTVWIWAATFTLTPVLFEAIPENFGIVAHCFATSMLFVGAMPLVKDSSNTAHNILGVSAGIFSQICVVLICPWWLVIWSFMACLIFGAMARFNDSCEIPKVFDGKGITIAELSCYIALVGVLFTYLLTR